MIRNCLYCMFGIFLSLPASGQVADSPMSRMRPIGSPSAVDRYQRPTQAVRYQETAYQRTANSGNAGATQGLVRQAQFEIPNDAAGFPAAEAPSAPALPGTLPTDPRSLPVNPNALPSPPPATSVPSSSDLTQIPQPQLNNGFATIDNCNCVSGPSTYSAASYGCAPVSYQTPGYAAPPAQIPAPAVLPGGLAPRTGGVPSGALISFGQETNPVVVGQGLVGQPVAYVPGQTFRNWVRYFFP